MELPSWVQHSLEQLTVTRVDLARAGVDDNAHIMLLKSRGGNSSMNFEEILKSMTPEHAEIIRAEVNKALAQVPEEVQKAKDEAEKKLAEMEANTAPPADDEAVMKSLDPAARAIIEKARAQAAAAEAAVKGFQAAELEAQAVNKAKEVAGVLETAQAVELYKSLPDAQRAVVFGSLAAAAKTIADGGLFTEIAKSQAHVDLSATAWGKVEQAAVEIRKSRAGMSTEAAVAEVIKTQPGLYQEYLNTLK